MMFFWGVAYLQILCPRACVDRKFGLHGETASQSAIIEQMLAEVRIGAGFGYASVMRCCVNPNNLKRMSAQRRLMNLKPTL